jgi:hypothetical protein
MQHDADHTEQHHTALRSSEVAKTRTSCSEGNEPSVLSEPDVQLDGYFFMIAGRLGCEEGEGDDDDHRYEEVHPWHFNLSSQTLDHELNTNKEAINKPL